MPLTIAERSGRYWPNQTHAGQLTALLAHDGSRCHLSERKDTAALAIEEPGMVYR